MTVALASDAPLAAQAMLETELTTRSMGGGLRLLVTSAPEDGDRAEQDLRRVAGRIDVWARRLTRFRATSDLSILNADPLRTPVSLRPTIGSVLSHARGMCAATEGTVDVAMLDARMAAESGDWSLSSGRSGWHLTGGGRQQALVRDGRVRFDLDGVAKGWIADRALRLLDAYPDALTDADGDIAVRTSWPTGWSIIVAHPHDERTELARLGVPLGWHTGRFGNATSGTSVHRWHRPDASSHHLIDPLADRPAVTDVVQATVVAETTGLAEALAKSAVIRGSHAGLSLLGRARAWAAVILTEDGDVLSSPGTLRWLA
jgi:thiamine biosynthesis lipoprotein ApbE